MHIVDSSGWLEWFTNDRLADKYGPYLAKSNELLVPSICIYEVYKVLKREVGEEKALMAIGYMKTSSVVPLDDNIALHAADLSIRYKIAMADSIIYATGLINNCTIITSDADFQELPSVTYFPKSNS